MSKRTRSILESESTEQELISGLKRLCTITQPVDEIVPSRYPNPIYYTDNTIHIDTSVVHEIDCNTIPKIALRVVLYGKGCHDITVTGTFNVIVVVEIDDDHDCPNIIQRLKVNNNNDVIMIDNPSHITRNENGRSTVRYFIKHLCVKFLGNCPNIKTTDLFHSERKFLEIQGNFHNSTSSCVGTFVLLPRLIPGPVTHLVISGCRLLKNSIPKTVTNVEIIHCFELDRGEFQPYTLKYEIKYEEMVIGPDTTKINECDIPEGIHKITFETQPHNKIVFGDNVLLRIKTVFIHDFKYCFDMFENFVVNPITNKPSICVYVTPRIIINGDYNQGPSFKASIPKNISINSLNITRSSSGFMRGDIYHYQFPTCIFPDCEDDTSLKNLHLMNVRVNNIPFCVTFLTLTSCLAIRDIKRSNVRKLYLNRFIPYRENSVVQLPESLVSCDIDATYTKVHVQLVFNKNHKYSVTKYGDDRIIYLRKWTTHDHYFFPQKFKDAVMMVMLIRQMHYSLSLVPREIMKIFFKYAIKNPPQEWL